MPEILTVEQMKQHYDGEWLLVAYTEIDQDLNVMRGEILAHSPDAEHLYKIMPQYKDRAVALEYIGEIPEDAVFVL